MRITGGRAPASAIFKGRPPGHAPSPVGEVNREEADSGAFGRAGSMRLDHWGPGGVCRGNHGHPERLRSGVAPGRAGGAGPPPCPQRARKERKIDLFAEEKPARKTKPPRSAPGLKPDPPLATKSVAAAAPKTPFANQSEDLLPPGVDYPPFVNDNICLKSWQSEERPDKKKGNLWQIPDKWPSVPGVKDVQPCQAPAGIDYKSMSKADYLAWVSLARENMLRLSGPLSPEQSEAFNRSWAPMFAHPSPQAMEYLGKLTPLLEKFNGGQEAMARLAGDMQTVLLRANATRTMGLEAEAGDLLARVRLHKNALQQLRAGQASLAAQIKALGNPPNPFENACKNRRAFDDGLKELKKLLRKDAKGGGWVLWAYQEENKNPKTTPFPYKLPKITETMVSVDIGLPWRIEADWKRPPDRIAPGQKWSFEPHVARKGDRSMDGRWPRELDLTCTHECDRGLLRRVDSNPLMYYRGANFPEHLQVEWTADVKPVKSKVAALLVTVKVLLGLPKNCDRENNPRKQWARVKPQTCTTLKEQEAPWLLVRRYLYIHEPVGVKLKVLGGMDPAYKKQMEEREAARRKELVELMARTTSLKQQIAAHEAFIQIYRDSLEKFKKELAREKDTKRRDELAYRLVILSSQISEEQDRIHYLKTGNELRTRTAFDEYAQQRMLAKSQEHAAKVQAVRGMADQAHALIDMLPPSERVEKRKLVYKMFDAKTLAAGDLGRGQKAFMATFKQVEGLIAKDQADKELAAIDRAEAGGHPRPCKEHRNSHGRGGPGGP